MSNSVQIMAFPVIGIERLFSIREPFEREKHIRRVNWLNGGWWGNALDEPSVFPEIRPAGVIWVTGLALSLVVALMFPVTTVAFYCNSDTMSSFGVETLFRKIFFVTLPLGLACVLITGIN